MSNDELLDERPEAFLRIQRSDEYAQFCNRPAYLASGQTEVRMFAAYMYNLFQKIGATAKKLVAGHLQEINKGYPEGFKDYLTYDERREKNFKDTIVRELKRKD